MMHRKEEWMKEGGLALVLGKVGTIKKLRVHNFGGQECVSLFDVQLDGSEEIQSYHPADVSEYPSGIQIKIENQ